MIDTLKSIMNFEKELHTETTRNDMARIDKLLSDSFKEFGTSGNVYVKSDVLGSLPLEDSSPIESSNWISDYIDQNSVLVTYDTTRIIDGLIIKAKRSSIWRLERRDWRLFFHHSSKVDSSV